MFADDACLSLTHKDPDTLENKVNNELININNWLHSNKLFLNYSKTNYLIFTKKKTKLKFNISINNHILKQQESIKYLGITIDQSLTWKPHIRKLQSTLSRNCYALSKLKDYVPEKTMKSVYYSLFFSKLKYCIGSWGGVSNTILDPIYKLQKRAIRCITSKPSQTPTHPLFTRLNILKLQDIYRFEICKLTNNLTINKLNGELKFTV